MFPHQVGVAHVGSSLTRDDYRDVDLRVVIEDADYVALVGVLDVQDLNMLLSRWGRQVTGLPIDCQLQQRSEHQREAFGPNGAPRHSWRGAGRLGRHAQMERKASGSPDLSQENERLRKALTDIISDFATSEVDHDSVFYTWERIVRRATGEVAQIIRDYSDHGEGWCWDMQLPSPPTDPATATREEGSHG